MKITRLLIVTLLMSFASSFSAKANVAVNSTNFPDANFLAYVQTLPGASDGTLTDTEIAAITSINCSLKGIKDLTGIKLFTGLETLDCSTPYFYIYKGTQTSLWNDITSLDVSGLTYLTSLNCSCNLNLTSLVTNGALLSLNCSRCKLTSLDLATTEPNLTNLDASFCGLSTLVTNGILEQLVCSYNNLPNLNVTGETHLTWLDASSCGISSIDVTHAPNLQTLSLTNNSLTSINVTQNPQLETLRLFVNKLNTAVNLQYNTALTYLSIEKNPDLPSLDVSHNTLLSTLYCNDCPKLGTINVDSNPLESFNCSNDGLTALDVSHKTDLVWFYCSKNKLTSTSLVFTSDMGFYRFYCDSNKLTSLDVSWMADLTDLKCNNNNINALQLSGTTALTTFNAANNGRAVKVYKYTRGSGYTGTDKVGYYIPLVDQTGTYPASAMGTLIDNAGDATDPSFDQTKVVSGSWTGATLSTIDGSQVLLLDTTAKKVTYNYNTEFTGTPTTWTTDNGATSPNVNFYLTWSPTDIVSGVDVFESNGINVFATPGTINVGGNYSGNVNVYNLRGQQVYSGNGSEIVVPAGMYVVKVDGTVHKVMVK
jgi:hypothetical protein